MQPKLVKCVNMLKNILAVTGKSGLFKLVSRGNNMLIIESLLDGKRTPTYARDKIVSLADISMFTFEEDVPLNEVLTSLYKHENGAACALDVKKADNDALRNFFAEVLPNFDRDRVYPSDIRKLIQWYNILVGAGFTDFSEIEEEGEEAIAVEEQKAAVQKPIQNKAVKTQSKAVKTQKNTAGAKKG